MVYIFFFCILGGAMFVFLTEAVDGQTEAEITELRRAEGRRRSTAAAGAVGEGGRFSCDGVDEFGKGGEDVKGGGGRAREIATGREGEGE